MDFSVLMSVYAKDEVEDFNQSLQSVTLAQTQKPKQVVIVQDGVVPSAIDDVIDAISKQAPEIEFSVLKKETNQGLAAALNSGLELCKYEWVARMDSDDIATPDRFEKQVAFLEDHPEVSVLGGAIAEFENQIGDIQSERRVGLTHEEITQMAKSRTPMNHVSVIYQKSAVLEVGGYCENFGKLEDYKLWVDLIVAGKIFANLDDIIVNVRIGKGFIERRSNKSEIQDWDMLQKYLLENKVITKRKAFVNKMYIRAFIYMPGWMKKIAYKTVLRKK